MVVRHAGYLLHAQNSLPEREPFIATRRAIVDPHLGQAFPTLAEGAGACPAARVSRSVAIGGTVQEPSEEAILLLGTLVSD